MSSNSTGNFTGNSTGLSKKAGLFLRDRLACRYCGKSFLKGELSVSDLTLDHIVPKSIGGTGRAKNLVTCCRSCNEIKASVVCSSIEEATEFIAKQRARRDSQFIRSTLVASGYPEDQYSLLDLLFAVSGR